MALKINRTTQRVIRGIGLVLLIAIIACMAKILIWETNYYRTKTSEERATADIPITRIVSPLNVSDKKPTDEEIAKYQVEAEKPRYIDIPSLNIHARVHASEANTNGLLTVPDNIYDANWYAGSSQPGHDGYVVISGIAAYRNNKGAFSELSTIKKDSEIKIETGNGNRYVYIVKEIDTISTTEDVDEALTRLQNRLGQKETLSLIAVKTSAEQEFESIIMLRATKKD